MSNINKKPIYIDFDDRLFLYKENNGDFEIRWTHISSVEEFKLTKNSETKEFLYFIDLKDYKHEDKDVWYEVIKANSKSYFALNDIEILYKIIKSFIEDLEPEEVKKFNIKMHFDAFLRMFEKNRNSFSKEKIVGVLGEVLTIKYSFEAGYDISNYFHTNSFAKLDLYVNEFDKSKYIEIKSTTNSSTIDIAKVKHDQLSLNKNSTLLVYVKLLYDENGKDASQIVKECLKHNYSNQEYTSSLDQLQQDLSDKSLENLKFDLDKVKIGVYKVTDLNIIDLTDYNNISNIKYDIILPPEKRRDISELKTILSEI